MISKTAFVDIMNEITKRSKTFDEINNVLDKNYGQYLDYNLGWELESLIITALEQAFKDTEEIISTCAFEYDMLKGFAAGATMKVKNISACCISENESSECEVVLPTWEDVYNFVTSYYYGDIDWRDYIKPEVTTS